MYRLVADGECVGGRCHWEALGEGFHWGRGIRHSFIGAGFFFTAKAGHESFVF